MSTTLKPKRYNVTCCLPGCYFQGRRLEKNVAASCPRCGGTDFWRSECKTRKQRTAEYLARWSAW